MTKLKENYLTDYEMQLWLENQGHKLYDANTDNQVDNEALAILAITYGFKWNDEIEAWVK